MFIFLLILLTFYLTGGRFVSFHFGGPFHWRFGKYPFWVPARKPVNLVQFLKQAPGYLWQPTDTPFRTLEFLQPPIQWVKGTLSLGAKRPGREADHSPNMTSWRGAQLKHKDNFTLNDTLSWLETED